MRVRLGFAVAAHVEPDVLLIDEVLAVGDASFVTRCITRMAALAKRTAMVFVSHQLSLVARVANRVVVLERGRARYSGTETSAAFDVLYASLQWPEKERRSVGRLELRSSAVHSGETFSRDGVLSIDAGSEISIELEILAEDPLPRCYVSLQLHDLEARGVLECDSRRSELVLEGQQGRVEISLVLPRLPINAGRFTLSMHVVELRPAGLPGELLLVERNFGRIEIRSALRAFAPLQPTGDWKVTASPLHGVPGPAGAR
jgi:lipopolysaccharide transport system ATP-binding protein